MKTSLEIIKELGLENYLKIVLLNNKANNLPYHNLFHTLCVMKNCYEICQDLDFGKVTNKEVKLLCIAALFHDFNHSGGEFKDDVNVNIACNNFSDYSKECIEDEIQIIKIICATQYPYVIENKDLTLLQMIIRDADLLQNCEDNWIQQTMFGLGSEMNFGLIPMLEGSKVFWSNINFHTSVATMKWCEIKETRFKEVDYLLEIIK